MRFRISSILLAMVALLLLLLKLIQRYVEAEINTEHASSYVLLTTGLARRLDDPSFWSTVALLLSSITLSRLEYSVRRRSLNVSFRSEAATAFYCILLICSCYLVTVAWKNETFF